MQGIALGLKVEGLGGVGLERMNGGILLPSCVCSVWFSWHGVPKITSGKLDWMVPVIEFSLLIMKR